MRNEGINRILVFAGTNEGRKLCEFLVNYQVSVTACVATDYGSLCLSDIPNLNTMEGRLSYEEICTLLESYDVIVDATHPYAQIISENIKKATQILNKPYIRIIRPTTDYDNVIKCNSIETACEYLNQVNGNALITTGSKELMPYTKILDYRERLFVRILPSIQSMEECLKHGLKTSNIIGIQGPFTEEMNIAMIKHVNAKYLVTKDTGKSGGFEEKLIAAKKCNVKVIVIGRPLEEEGMSLKEAYEYFHNRLKTMDASYGTHFPIFLDLKAKKVVVIGAGNIAARRIKTLLKFQTQIIVIAPSICDEIQRLEGKVVIQQKEYEESDLSGASLVIAATNQRNINHKIYEDAKQQNILVNVVDQKEENDFYFPAILNDKDIIGGIISKNGMNHKLVKEKAELIRNYLERE